MLIGDCDIVITRQPRWFVCCQINLSCKDSLLLLLVVLITLAVLVNGCRILAYVCVSKAAIAVSCLSPSSSSGCEWGGWLSDIGSLGRPWIGREHKERPMGSKVAKGWFWRREMILSEWRRKLQGDPEHKWGDPIEMVELGSENDWVASERLTRNESGNRAMHYSTSSPRRWMQACFKFIASVHFNALLQPRLHRPLFLAPPPPPPPALQNMVTLHQMPQQCHYMWNCADICVFCFRIKSDSSSSKAVKISVLEVVFEIILSFT